MKKKNTFNVKMSSRYFPINCKKKKKERSNHNPSTTQTPDNCTHVEESDSPKTLRGFFQHLEQKMRHDNMLKTSKRFSVLAHGAPLPPRLPSHRLQRSSGSVCELRLVFGESRASFEPAARQKNSFLKK